MISGHLSCPLYPDGEKNILQKINQKINLLPMSSLFWGVYHRVNDMGRQIFLNALHQKRCHQAQQARWQFSLFCLVVLFSSWLGCPWLQSSELSQQTAFMTGYHQPKNPWNCLLGQCKDLHTRIFIIHSFI